MTARNKQRGYELERETVLHWQSKGLKCERTFASGAHKVALGEMHAGDIRLEGFMVEAKRKKSGFKFLYDAMAQDDADIVVVKQDRHQRIYILREETLEKLLKGEGA
jgi:Holliday junction resolvase